jgi:hypothetical protein
MANWSYNEYAVKAATENVLNFVNEGLKNLGTDPKDNIKDAIECLWKDGNEVLMSTFRPIPGTIKKLTRLTLSRKETICIAKANLLPSPMKKSD